MAYYLEDRDKKKPMPTFRNKKKWSKPKRRTEKTGEDIAMLYESSLSPQEGRSGSVAYKDHIDGA